VPEKIKEKIISEFRGKPGELLTVLEELQKNSPHNYLSPEILEYTAEKLDIPLSQVYSVVTFYAFFNLKPQGEHVLTVCRGTACHTRGSRKLLENLKDIFYLEESDIDENSKVFVTTKNNKFTIRTVACFGQCALAPVVEIDGKVYSNMNEGRLKKIIKGIK
jgi:NADH-quinone oxidoreductase subunit E